MCSWSRTSMRYFVLWMQLNGSPANILVICWVELVFQDNKNLSSEKCNLSAQITCILRASNCTKSLMLLIFPLVWLLASVSDYQERSRLLSLLVLLTVFVCGCGCFDINVMPSATLTAQSSTLKETALSPGRPIIFILHVYDLTVISGLGLNQWIILQASVSMTQLDILDENSGHLQPCFWEQNWNFLMRSQEISSHVSGNKTRCFWWDP